MAKVVVTFRDVGKDGEAEVAFDADPAVDVMEGNSEAFTSAQLLARRVLNYIANIDDENNPENAEVVTGELH